MPEILLQTKLFVPQLRPLPITRPHLIHKLNTGLNGKLTLVSAPAGFGKTTLVSGWLQQCERPFSWLSLDKEDNEPARFFTYLLAAVQKIEAGLGQTAVSLLQSSQSPPPETLLTLLINDLAVLFQPIILVLEDYHLIQNLDIHKALTFLLDNLPHQLHLVITSREDPPLPLYRLRSSGQMNGIYAHDLRFNLDETTNFLQQTMHVDLAPEDVARLARRTEGWVAGLQLAALSLQDLPDAHQFVTHFAGDDRYIADYLLHEVIERQPADIHDFLLKTAVFDRFSPSLCDAVLETPPNHARDILTQLEEINLFIIPLDNKRQWYRYHHLFADFLRLRWREHPTEELMQLHCRAANWFETHGLLDEAINHSLAGEDYERACHLIENHVKEILWEQAQWRKLLNWVESLPANITSTHPRLSLQYAWSLLTVGQRQLIAPVLDNVETALNNADEDEATKHLWGENNILRAWLALETDDITNCIELASAAIKQLPDEARRIKGLGFLCLGIAHFWLGQFNESRPYLENAVNAGLSAGNLTVTVLAMGYQIHLEVRLGKLRRAATRYHEARQLGTFEGVPLVNTLGKACNQMGMVLWEQGQLPEAIQLLKEAISLNRQSGAWDNVIRAQMALTRIFLAMGDKTMAAEQFIQTDTELLAWIGRDNNIRFMEWVFIQRARYWLAIGKVAEVIAWLNESGIQVGGEAIPANDERYLLLAKILIARQQAEAAYHLLHQLLPIFEHNEALGYTIETLVLLAIAAEVCGQRQEAVQALSQALRLAEAEGYQRIFLDEGEPLSPLLVEVEVTGTTAVYAQTLRAAMQGTPATPPPKESPPTTTIHKATTSNQPEPLTERELQILRLMAAGLSNKEIAAELYLSVNTIKTYTARIYEKFGVHSRAEAVNYAHELGQL